MASTQIRTQFIANRFKIHDREKDLLGRGSMGAVYRATDTQTGQLVALKALDPGTVARDPDLLERFAREGEALRQLNHPNIVRMVAAVEDETKATGVVTHYLVLEYVAGGSLQDLLAGEGPLASARTVEIALDLADALTRAHRLGIIHRDLKPANVLLAEDGTPRLTDFGLAHMAESPRLTQTGILVGTLAYLSPEACEGEAVDERGDIWSFGVLLYEMLAGERPFGGKGLSATLTAILTQPVPDLARRCPQASDGLVDLVYRMLEKDRQQRIPSVRLVGAELEAILKGREVQAPARAVVGESRFSTPTPDAVQRHHNLPVQPTPFVGREAELTELARQLADPDVRLLTVLGAGGMGKTRLALEAAAAELYSFEHGVHFVALAPLQSLEAIVPTVAEALDFRFYEGGEPRQQLLDYLRKKRKLLVLDNFEHLLDGVDLVSEVLRYAPQVKILSTSRARLKVQGEHLFHLTGMDLPDWETPEDALQYSAVKLFLQSARRVRPGFELAAADLKYVARICRLVQGMPLGILLAAGWLEMLAPAEIAAEIGRSLDFLETDLRDVPERQRSMRAVFDHSWGLLTEREQEVLQGLSVFRGGFTREAAQEVTGASLRELMALVNKSLLGREPGGRYGIHELLRQFATEYLNASEEADGARLRHREFYLALAEDAEPELEGPEPAVWMSRLDAEHDNLRAALAWSLDRADGVALRLAGALGWFWRSRGQHAEGRDWLTRALARSVEHGDGLDQHRAKALCLAGELAWCQSDYEVAATLEAESARLYRATGDKGGLGGALTMWAAVAYQQRDLTRARALVEESIALLRQTDDRLILAKALFWRGHLAYSGGDYNTAAISAKESMKLAQAIGALNWIAGPTSTLGRIALDHGDYAAAQSFYGTSLAAYRQAENKVGVSIVLRCLAVLSYAQGRYDSAGAFYKENLELAQETGDKRTSAWALNCLGYVALKLNDRCEAQTRFVEGLALFLSLEDREGTAACLIPLAELRAEGEPEVAAWLLGSAHATVTRIEKRSPSVALVEFQAEYGRTAAEVEAQLGEAAFANAWAEGRKLELEATAAELLRELGE